MPQGQRIALGTVQLGLPYGIANRTGQPDAAQARDIVQQARMSGIITIDTAMSYGESESVLGTCGVHGLNVVTKLAPVPEGEPSVAAWARAQVERSLQRLGCQQLYGLLLHRPADALGPGAQELLAELGRLRQQGLIRKLGVSIYDPGELAALFEVMDIELVQAPYNVLDRRLSASGWLAQLRARGVEVHTRSAFLQGLLLMDPEQLPPGLRRWHGSLTVWHEWARASGMSAVRAALGFILREAAVDRVVVGVESAAQLREIVSQATPLEVEPPAQLACADLDLIDPSRWKKH